MYNRAIGQRLVWTTPDAMLRQLTQGYARASAAAIVQDQFRAASEAEPEAEQD